MAARKTKAERDRIAAEQETEAEQAVEPTKQTTARYAPPVAAKAEYSIGPADFTEKEGAVVSWTAELTHNGTPIGKVTWNMAKKAATVTPLAKTPVAVKDVKRFEDTAKRLLPGRDSVTDLVIVLGVVSSSAISPANQALLTNDIPGAADILEHPERLAPED
jgi:hypothetical protein